MKIEDTYNYKLLRDYYKLLAETITLRFNLEETVKEKKESEVLTITKERVLFAAEKCESAKEILKEIFPEVFKEEYCCISFQEAYRKGAVFKKHSYWSMHTKEYRDNATYNFDYCPWCGRKLNPS